MKSVICCAIASLAVAGMCPAASTVVAYYQMGELEISGGASIGGTATTLLATTGTNMTATGTPTIGSGGARAGSTAYMNFDGVLEHYEVTPNNLGSGTTTGWLLEAWVRPQAGSSGFELIVSHGHGGVGQVLSYDATANRYGWFVGGFGQINGTVAASGIGTTWDHLALVRESGVTTLYVNGLVAGSSTQAGTGGAYANGSAIGSQYTGGGNNGFTGDIDEVYFSTVSGFNAATDLHMIPEPSVALLGGLGALALLRRRRN